MNDTKRTEIKLKESTLPVDGQWCKYDTDKHTDIIGQFIEDENAFFPFQNNPTMLHSAFEVNWWEPCEEPIFISGIDMIREERMEQIKKHGRDLKHDDGHQYGELSKVAATLAVLHTDATVDCPEGSWGSSNDPWGLEKKLKYKPIHALKVAGALIAAEIDRIQRREAQKEQKSE